MCIEVSRCADRALSYELWGGVSHVGWTTDTKPISLHRKASCTALGIKFRESNSLSADSLHTLARLEASSAWFVHLD